VMFGEFNWHTRSTFRPTRSVRDERYKLILSLRAEGEDDVELFDLQDDPHEFNNLAGRESLRDVQERLLQQLLAWRQRTNDPLLDRGQIALQREKYYAAN
jgi:arylsulfatase A-like enzyme